MTKSSAQRVSQSASGEDPHRAHHERVRVPRLPVVAAAIVGNDASRELARHGRLGATLPGRARHIHIVQATYGFA
jgi:hypothetical protein